ncbi:MAG: hypothetical protein JKY65_33240 [Planctomycetes bacterium]|nr:hypothetical protein [Planctomycetota bacterium]
MSNTKGISVSGKAETSDPIAEAFHGTALLEAAELRRANPAEFQALREKLKQSRAFQINEWDRLVAAASRTIRPLSNDETVRHAIRDGVSSGFYFRHDSGEWVQTPSPTARTLLRADYREGADEVFAGLVRNSYRIVCEPFAGEYPRKGVWNKHAAQLACKPRAGAHPTWSLVLDRLGQNLNAAAGASEWCQANAIKAGGHYLLAWLASMIQNPTGKAPYLFFFGPQNSGKSTFHEAAKLLFRAAPGQDGVPVSKRHVYGVVAADEALKNKGGFNRELEGQVLGVVEEVNLNAGGGGREAYNRLKSWVTGHTLPIHEKGATPRDVTNSMRFVQCANEASACLVLEGDTRITMIHVERPETDMPKGELFALLEDEVPAILHALTSMVLPEPPGRLVLPVLRTDERRELERANRSLLQEFLAEEKFWFALSAEQIRERMSKRFANRTTLESWDVPRIRRTLLDLGPRVGGANLGAIGRATAQWFRAKGCPEWQGSAEDMAQAIGSPVGKWNGRKMAIALKRLGGEDTNSPREALLMVGIRATAPGPSDRPRNWTLRAVGRSS